MTKPKMPEPVAYVTDVFQIVWSGTGPIASMVDRHEITTGTPLITTTQAEAYKNARVREALKEAYRAAFDAWKVIHDREHSKNSFRMLEAIRALIPSTPA